MNKLMINFSQAKDRKLYDMFADYFRHYRANKGVKGLTYQTHHEDGTIVAFSEKEQDVHNEMKKEIARVAGIGNMDDFPVEVWATNPTLSWATFAVVNTLIDAILPEVLVKEIGAFTDIKVIGWGDSATFDIEPRDLFVVSKAGRGMAQGELKKQYRGQVAVIPEAHVLTVDSSLYRVLSGQESLARFAAKAVLSMEASVTRDAYSAFATAMASLDAVGADALRISGWADATFLNLAQTVEAWNGGARPVLMGTKLALGSVLPTSNVNYRYDLESDYVRMGYIKEFKGFGVLEMPQVAAWETEFNLAIDDTKLWLLSPTAGKLVKLVLEGATLSNTTGQFGNANLTQQTNLIKNWGTGIATSAIAGTIELS